MTTTLQVREPQELLALIPYQLGFRPRESLVVVSLREPRRRVGLVARVDLADLAGPAGPGTDAVATAPDPGPDLATSLVAHVVSDGGRSAVLVVYTDDDVPRTDSGDAGDAGDGEDVGGDPGSRGRAALRAVDRFRDAAAPFIDPVEVWVVTRTGYYALGCADEGCCPPAGRPIADLSATRVGAQMVLEGATVAPERADLVGIPDAPSEARRRTAAAAGRSRGRRRAARGADELMTWQRTGLVAWRTATAHAAADLQHATEPAVLGRIEAGIEDILVRDAVLVSLVPDTADLPERLLAGRAGDDTDSAVGRAIAAIVDPRAGVRPDRATSAAARVVLERVVAHGGAGRQAPALTLLALLAWWGGSGARAGALLERAATADPAYRLARLVGQAVEAGMPPGWASCSAPRS